MSCGLNPTAIQTCFGPAQAGLFLFMPARCHDFAGNPILRLSGHLGTLGYKL